MDLMSEDKFCKWYKQTADAYDIYSVPGCRMKYKEPESFDLLYFHFFKYCPFCGKFIIKDVDNV